ncbi:hypothetical protein ABDB91_14855 [Desulfoscipio sp. XC116]|uniref:hypothetical protein n=1 Tax=Desulfoscipio sp. XC116 TaxID=3144975 RepID=UPI00325A64FA
MKILLSLLISLLFLLAVGCESLDNTKNENPSAGNKDGSELELSKSIGIKRSNLTSEDFNKYMNDVGFIVSGNQNEKLDMRSSKDKSKVIYILKNLYHKDDYIYLDLIIDSAYLDEQAEIEIQYDNETSYSIARINSKNLSQVRNAIGYSSYQIIDSSKDAWIGFIFKKRTSDVEFEVPLTIDLNKDYSAYIILTLQDTTNHARLAVGPDLYYSQQLPKRDSPKVPG